MKFILNPKSLRDARRYVRELDSHVTNSPGAYKVYNKEYEYFKGLVNVMNELRKQYNYCNNFRRNIFGTKDSQIDDGENFISVTPHIKVYPKFKMTSTEPLNTQIKRYFDKEVSEIKNIASDAEAFVNNYRYNKPELNSLNEKMKYLSGIYFTHQINMNVFDNISTWYIYRDKKIFEHDMKLLTTSVKKANLLLLTLRTNLEARISHLRAYELIISNWNYEFTWDEDHPQDFLLEEYNELDDIGKLYIEML